MYNDLDSHTKSSMYTQYTCHCGCLLFGSKEQDQEGNEVDQNIFKRSDCHAPLSRNQYQVHVHIEVSRHICLEMGMCGRMLWGRNV